MAPECRCDCGYPGITPAQCEAKGCCDNGTKGSHAIPACFYTTGGAHKPPPPPPAPGCSAVINATACAAVPVGCRKTSCGWPGMKAAQCTARGCCWDESDPSTWCFHKGSGPVPPLPPPPPPTQIPLHCPNASAQADMRQALKDGHIVMHAFPFDAEPEVLDSQMFSWALNFTAELARAHSAAAPTVLSQRDVPSLTRAAIPLLVAAGVKGINVGINPASAPLGVPSVAACESDGLATPFVWLDEGSNSSVLAAFHPGGYGGIGGDSPNLNCDCLAAPGLDEVSCVLLVQVANNLSPWCS